MRSVVVGLVLIVAFSVAVLSIRPGGLRRQLRFAARRFRIALVLGGAYVFLSAAIRVVFATGFVADYGPLLLAAVSAVAFLYLARDPNPASASVPASRGR